MGVHPPVDETALASASAVAQAILAKNTRPALMGIEVKPPVNEGDLPVRFSVLLCSCVCFQEGSLALHCFYGPGS